MRDVLDRLLTGLARLVLRGFFRDVEVDGREHLPEDRPVLVVANHFNALVDAVLMVHALGRLPRFVAKSTLWRPVWARPLLWLAGLVPVHRPQDRTGGREQNHSTFLSCHEQLAKGGAVALFPEGRVSPAPRPRPVRTGAARIAIGARQAGADDLAIVPVGLVYEDKVALRSRALVRIGAPIDVDRELVRLGISEATADDPHAVRVLTDEIQQRLEVLAPVYRDEQQAAFLGQAADVALREPDRLPPDEVPLRRREELGRRLAAAPDADQDRLMDRLARYHLGLALLGLSDAYLVAGYRVRRLARLLLVTAMRLAVLAPVAAIGAAVNALPYWGVHWAGRLLPDPALRASARMLVGVVLFPVAWLAAVWLAPFDRWWARALMFVALPVAGLIAVRALEQMVAVRRTWRGWIGLIERGGQLQRLRDDRAELVHRVMATARQVPPDVRGTGNAHETSESPDTRQASDAPGANGGREGSASHSRGRDRRGRTDR